VLPGVGVEGNRQPRPAARYWCRESEPHLGDDVMLPSCIDSQLCVFHDAEPTHPGRGGTVWCRQAGAAENAAAGEHLRRVDAPAADAAFADRRARRAVAERRHAAQCDAVIRCEGMPST